MKSTLPKVSIIVPVYNVEKYLHRCMDSLINQTLEDIEIMVINDGSTDSSRNILREYERKDKRVIVIDNKNLGVSHSRNIGIDKSKGEFLLFVDSDDWIDLNMIEEMYVKALSNNSDIVMCSYMREFENHSKEKIFNLDKEVVYKNEQVIELNRKIIGPINNELKSGEGLDSLGTVWAKMYKSNLIKNSQHRFIDLKEIGSAEDTLFNILIFKNANTVTFLNNSFYHYWRGNKESLTSGYNPKLLSQWKKLFTYMEDFIKEHNLGQEFYEALNNRIAMCVLGLGLNECSKKNNQSILKKIRNIKQILNDNLIKESYKKFDISKFSIHWRIFYIFNKNRMAFLSYSMLNVIEFLRTRV